MKDSYLYPRYADLQCTVSILRWLLKEGPDVDRATRKRWQDHLERTELDLLMARSRHEYGELVERQDVYVLPGFFSANGLW